jgi:hypothetical protein
MKCLLQKRFPRCLGPALIAALFFCIGSSALPEEAYGDPFAQGMVRSSLSLGGGSAFGDDYFIIGLGSGIFLFDGFELGMDVEFWTGGKNNIYKITPEVKYVLNLNSPFKPYAGVFYRYSSIYGLPDINSSGVRAGIYYTPGQTVYLGLGVVHEVFHDADRYYHGDASTNTYPEFVIGTTF